MKQNYINRLKELEKSMPTPITLLVIDTQGKELKCSIEEYEQHAHEWDFKKLLNGSSSDEIRRLFAAWVPDSAI